MSKIEDEYRRLLRWYPKSWRDKNEDVVVGSLLESARDNRQAHITADDRRSIMFAGMRQRAIGTSSRSLVATIALGAGVAFSIFYCGVVGWDPGHTYNGFIGPFTNPCFIIGLLIAIAFALSIRCVTAAARAVAMLAIATSVVIGILAWNFGWQGPSAPGVVLFAAFGACGLSRSNKISSRLFVLAGASVSAVFAAECLETMGVQSTWALSPWWQEETLLVVLGVVAATLLAWPWRRRTRSRQHD
jgi:hypothetical protein